MRKTKCERCGEEFIEEHNPNNFKCQTCWDKENDEDEYDIGDEE